MNPCLLVFVLNLRAGNAGPCKEYKPCFGEAETTGGRKRDGGEGVALARGCLNRGPVIGINPKDAADRKNNRKKNIGQRKCAATDANQDQLETNGRSSRYGET